VYAAQQGLAQKVGVKMHQYGLAFALSNFKLQGRTLPKLILSVCKRSRAPWMTLASFYVLISRVRELAGLRLLQEDSAALSAVSQFKTDEYLHGWERGYDAETGLWDDALAARAVRELRRSATRPRRRRSRRRRRRPPPRPRRARRSGSRPRRRPQRSAGNSRPRRGARRRGRRRRPNGAATRVASAELRACQTRVTLHKAGSARASACDCVCLFLSCFDVECM